MSATGVNTFRKLHNVSQISVPAGENNAMLPLLEVAVSQANAQGACVYRFDRENNGAPLAAFAGPAPDDLPLSEREAYRAILALHGNRKMPVVLPANAGADWRFRAFPEFQTRRLDGVVSIPLLDSGDVVGVANFRRTADAPLSADTLTFLISLSLPLGSLLVASTLRDQLERAHRDLADRKLVERAKGLLQERFQWTEEEAYLHLRHSSRRRRTPMREIAREIIEQSWTDLPAELVQHE
jgi:two-component system, response regulator PdtaR